jgi:Transposase DDE domain
MIVYQSLPGVKQFFPSRWVRPAVWLLLLRLMAGFVCHRGKMSLSQVAGIMPSQSRHRANLGRCLERAACLTGPSLWNRLERRMIERERRRRGRWVFIVDQTYCGQQGQKTENTFSRANYRPRARHSNRHQKKGARRSCHGFVCGLLITPSGCRIPCFHSYYTHEYSQQRGCDYQTQTDLAAELIRQLPLPKAVALTVLGDTAFDADVIRSACQERGAHWIVPINPERVLQGPKPRPRVRSLSERLQACDFTAVRLKPGQGEFAAHSRVARCRLGPRTKSRRFYVHRERQCVRRVGDVQLIFSTNQLPASGKSPKICKTLMTNDLKRSMRDIVVCYDVRWQIELFFKELKSTLGLDHYSFRRFTQVEGWVAACFITFLYLEWRRDGQLRCRQTAQRKRWWRSQRTHGLCQVVTQQTEQNGLHWILKTAQTVRGQSKLRKLLCQTIPKEYRQPA